MRFTQVTRSLLVVLVVCRWSFAGEKTFRIEADDLLRFSLTSMQVNSGDSVTVILKNVGRLPSHGHNFVLLEQGADASLFAGADHTTGPLPSKLRTHVLASTALAGPGQEVTGSFIAPAPGKYTYICTYPGHLTMSKGTLTVK